MAIEIAGQFAAAQSPSGSCKRSGADRRRSTFGALFHGSFKQRRRRIRRASDRHVAAIDWHHPQWLAVSMLILLLCAGDAFMTLTLISLGAEEANPIMEPLVLGSGPAFAIWKMGLTSAGVIVLTILAQLRAFGRLPIGLLLYAVLAGYIVLIAYEFWLLDHILLQAYAAPAA
jgi:hypothetical protein